MKSIRFFRDNKISNQLNENDTRAVEKVTQNSTTEARTFIGYDQAKSLLVLPLKVETQLGRSTLVVASAHETAQHVKQILQFSSGLSVEVISMEKELLPQAIFNAYKSDVDSLQASANNLLSIATVNSFQGSSILRYDQGTGDIAKFVAKLIDYCIVEKASDIHITPLLNGTRIRIRKNGDLLEHDQVVGTAHTHPQIVKRLKVLANIPITSNNEPIDGAFMAGESESEVRIRLSCMPSLHGENIVLRLHNNNSTLKLNNLGYSHDLYDLILDYSNKPNGLFVFAGPTGSGKTTALYALMQELKSRSLCIHTIEDPIEQTIDGVVQTAVNVEAGLTYAKCLKAVLRQDPDVLVVGELRDTESAKLIVQAALTGHLVLTTVHARSTTEVIQRFQHYGVNTLDLFSSLQAIVCQELCPLLCEKCKIVDLSNAQKANVETSRAVGCSFCDFSQYAGRTPINEYLFLTNKIQPNELEANLKAGNLINFGIFHNFKSSVIKLLKSGMIDWQTARNFL